MERINITIDESDVGERIDVFLSKKLRDISRSHIKSLIKDGKVLVDGNTTKPNYKTRKGDNIFISIPPPKKMNTEPENIPINIIYEDNDIIVINKPQGMVVHPAPGNYSGTLVNALLYHCDNLSEINGAIRPGIVHRIDKDTSGLLVVAKNDMAHIKLAHQLQSKTMSRIYWTIVEYNIKQDNGIIDAPIGRHPIDRKRMAVVESGRRAVTHYEVLERFGDYTLVKAQLETGRTHQIRVHMAYIGHPVVGDPVYGIKKQRFNLKGQVLHAKQLTLIHPRSGEKMTFEAPLPEYFEKLLSILKN